MYMARTHAPRKRFLANAAAAFFVSLTGSCAPAESSPHADVSLAEVRAATEKYQNVEVAIADGFVRDPLNICETPYHAGLTEETGVMGIHFLRRELLGIPQDGTRLDVTGTHANFLQPAVLLYEPHMDGSLELLALENLVSAEAWSAAGNDAPPSFQGREFHYQGDDRSMGVRAHYDLHVWLYRENPKGRFAPYNPDATCQHHVYDMPMMHPMP